VVVEEAAGLALGLVVAVEGEGRPLRVTVEWGEFRETALLDERGEASFGPVGWQEEELRLVVEPVKGGA
jgi:hypothetical protein